MAHRLRQVTSLRELLREVSQMTASVLPSPKMGKKAQDLPSLICFVTEQVLSPPGPQTAHQDG